MTKFRYFCYPRAISGLRDPVYFGGFSILRPSLSLETYSGYLNIFFFFRGSAILFICVLLGVNAFSCYLKPSLYLIWKIKLWLLRFTLALILAASAHTNSGIRFYLLISLLLWFFVLNILLRCFLSMYILS